MGYKFDIQKEWILYVRAKVKKKSGEYELKSNQIRRTFFYWTIQKLSSVWQSVKSLFKFESFAQP